MNTTNIHFDYTDPLNEWDDLLPENIQTLPIDLQPGDPDALLNLVSESESKISTLWTRFTGWIGSWFRSTLQEAESISDLYSISLDRPEEIEKTDSLISRIFRTLFGTKKTEKTEKTTPTAVYSICPQASVDRYSAQVKHIESSPQIIGSSIEIPPNCTDQWERDRRTPTHPKIEINDSGLKTLAEVDTAFAVIYSPLYGISPLAMNHVKYLCSQRFMGVDTASLTLPKSDDLSMMTTQIDHDQTKVMIGRDQKIQVTLTYTLKIDTISPEEAIGYEGTARQAFATIQRTFFIDKTSGEVTFQGQTFESQLSVENDTSRMQIFEKMLEAKDWDSTISINGLIQQYRKLYKDAASDTALQRLANQVIETTFVTRMGMPIILESKKSTKIASSKEQITFTGSVPNFAEHANTIGRKDLAITQQMRGKYTGSSLKKAGKDTIVTHNYRIVHDQDEVGSIALLYKVTDNQFRLVGRHLRCFPDKAPLNIQTWFREESSNALEFIPASSFEISLESPEAMLSFEVATSPDAIEKSRQAIFKAMPIPLTIKYTETQIENDVNKIIIRHRYQLIRDGHSFGIAEQVHTIHTSETPIEIISTDPSCKITETFPVITDHARQFIFLNMLFNTLQQQPISSINITDMLITYRWHYQDNASDEALQSIANLAIQQFEREYPLRAAFQAPELRLLTMEQIKGLKDIPISTSLILAPAFDRTRCSKIERDAIDRVSTYLKQKQASIIEQYTRETRAALQASTNAQLNYVHELLVLACLISNDIQPNMIKIEQSQKNPNLYKIIIGDLFSYFEINNNEIEFKHLQEHSSDLHLQEISNPTNVLQALQAYARSSEISAQFKKDIDRGTYYVSHNSPLYRTSNMAHELNQLANPGSARSYALQTLLSQTVWVATMKEIPPYFTDNNNIEWLGHGEVSLPEKTQENRSYIIRSSGNTIQLHYNRFTKLVDPSQQGKPSLYTGILPLTITLDMSESIPRIYSISCDLLPPEKTVAEALDTFVPIPVSNTSSVGSDLVSSTIQSLEQLSDDNITKQIHIHLSLRGMNHIPEEAITIKDRKTTSKSSDECHYTYTVVIKENEILSEYNIVHTILSLKQSIEDTFNSLDPLLFEIVSNPSSKRPLTPDIKKQLQRIAQISQSWTKDELRTLDPRITMAVEELKHAYPIAFDPIPPLAV